MNQPKQRISAFFVMLYLLKAKFLYECKRCSCKNGKSTLVQETKYISDLHQSKMIVYKYKQLSCKLNSQYRKMYKCAGTIAQ